jgi:hypothetical protein
MGRSREWKRSSQTSDIGDVLRLLHCACYIYQHPMRISRRRTVTILVHHFLGTSHITGPSDALSILLYLNHRPASGRTPPAWLARLAHHPHPPMSGHLYAGSVPSLYILMPVSGIVNCESPDIIHNLPVFYQRTVRSSSPRRLQQKRNP